jgi:hypothetical protein
MRALVAGWFSFPDMGATAGDLLSRDLAREWLARAGWESDVAHAPPFHGGVDWRKADPAAYDALVFVCGPFGNGWPVTELLERFADARLIGLNLSMLEPLDAWNPFDLLTERDSSKRANPDVSFLSREAKVPVVGVVLVHPQTEYEGAMHEAAGAAIDQLLASREAASVRIDTRLDRNATGLRTPAEVESLIARMDVVVTTRLHGLVLALKNVVPVVAIDPIAGGAKVLRQAQTVDWPHAFAADAVSDDQLARAFSACLTEEARGLAHACRARAVARVRAVRDDLVASLSDLGEPAGQRTGERG